MFEWDLGLTQCQLKEQVAGGKYIGGRVYRFPIFDLSWQPKFLYFEEYSCSLVHDRERIGCVKMTYAEYWN